MSKGLCLWGCAATDQISSSVQYLPSTVSEQVPRHPARHLPHRTATKRAELGRRTIERRSWRRRCSRLQECCTCLRQWLHFPCLQAETLWLTEEAEGHHFGETT